MGSTLLLSLACSLLIPASIPQIPNSDLAFAAESTKSDHPIFASTLDSEGYQLPGFSRATYEGLRIKVKKSSGHEKAKFHVHLGEFAFARLEDPQLATYHFKTAISLGDAPVRSLSKFNRGLVRLRQGAHSNALAIFQSLQESRKEDLAYVGKFNLARWAKVAARRAGARESVASLGVPVPKDLNPLCGIESVANSLETLHGATLARQFRNVAPKKGFGNSAGELMISLDKIGVKARLLSANESGFRALPKPLVAFVEHERFVQVKSASRDGVAIACSDCNRSDIRLTWEQWRAMSPEAYVVFEGASKNTKWIRWIRPSGPSAQLASVSKSSSAILSVIPMSAAYKSNTKLNCGGWVSNGRAQPNANNPNDGDPVNLATGEETHSAGPDLNIYNPIGPSVVMQRAYNHFDVDTLVGLPNSLNRVDFGKGWTQAYNLVMYDPNLVHVPQLEPTVSTFLDTVYPESFSSSITWEVLQNGTQIATSASPAGWSRSGVSRASVHVTAPSGLTQATDFKLRYRGSDGAGIYERAVEFDVLPADSLRQDTKGKLTATGTDAPAGSATWDIVNSGTVIATSASTNGWLINKIGSNRFELTVPVTAQVGNNYKFRFKFNPFGTASYFSLPFSVLDARLKMNVGTRYFIQANRSRVAADAGSIPNSGTPSVNCNVQAGAPYAIAFKYDPTNPYGYYEVVLTDGNTLTMSPVVKQTSAQTWVNYVPTKMTNRVGAYITFEYDYNVSLCPVPMLKNIKRSDGVALLTLTRDGNGSITSATDCYSRSVYYTHSLLTDGRRVMSVSMVVPTGTPNPQKRFEYGYLSDIQTHYDLLHTITYPSPTGTGNSVFTINYDTVKGVASSQVDANGNKREYTEIAANKTKVSIKDSSNTLIHSYTVTFDARGNTTEITDGTNSTILSSMAYTDGNAPDRPSVVVDGEGRTWQHTYDVRGNVLTVTSPKNVVETYTYDYSSFPIGQIVQAQHGTKAPTTYDYYPNGLLYTIDGPTPDGSTGTQTFTYTSLGNLSTVTKPGNGTAPSQTISYGYTNDGAYSQSEAVGQAITITDSLSRVAHFRYDTQGRVTSYIDPMGNVKTHTYNILGQITATTEPPTGRTGPGNTTHYYSYPFAGSRVSSYAIYNESGVLEKQLHYNFGPAGEFLNVTGDVDLTSYTYDACYRLASMTDNLGRVTSYNYDTAGNLSLINYPGGETASYSSYDLSGSLLQSVSPSGVITNYAYNDAEGQLTDIEYVGDPSLDTVVSYDSYGRVTSVSTGAEEKSFTYGDLDEVLTKTTEYAGLSPVTLTYTYNPDGTRSSVTTPIGAFTYGYNAIGEHTSLTNPFSETTSWLHDVNGRLQQQTYANGIVQSISSFADGQVSGMEYRDGSNALLAEYTGLTYDAVGRLKQFQTNIPSNGTLAGTNQYTYDNQGRLLQEASSRFGGYTQNFVYDSVGNITNFNGSSRSYSTKNQPTATGFTFDLDGNPTTYNGISLTFNKLDQLTSYGSTVTSESNISGLRAWKQNSAGRTYFIYDGLAPLLEIDASGAVTAVNTFGANGLVSRREASTSTFYTFDLRGGTALRLDSSGAIVSSHAQDAYGQPWHSTTTTDPYSGLGAQYGYRLDHESGLYLAGGRYYDPSWGRFINRDPAGYAGGHNLYAYCGNNPISIVDPTGLDGGPWTTNLNHGLRDAAEEWKNNSLAYWVDKPGGVLISTIGNSSVDLVVSGIRGFLSFGCGIGRFWSEPTLENVPGVVMDALTAVTTVSGGVGILRGGASKLGALADEGAETVGTAVPRATGAGASGDAVIMGKSLTPSNLELNSAQGKVAEAIVEKALQSSGRTYKKQVTATTSGQRRIDFLVQRKNGTWYAIEVKSGGAVRSSSQLIKDREMAAVGAKIVGINAPEDLLNKIVKLRTWEIRIP